MRKLKPSRVELLVVIGELQQLIGEARSKHGNDRDPRWASSMGNKHFVARSRFVLPLAASILRPTDSAFLGSSRSV